MIAFPGIPPVAGYLGVALLVGGEAAGLLLPGETALVAAAALASQGRLSLPLVIGAAATGAIVGDNVGYLIGRHGWRRLLALPGRGHAWRRMLLERGESFVARRGAVAVFLGRWVPWLRMSVAWIAGAGRMRWSAFALWNALGGIVWAAAVGLAGYAAGKAAAAVLGGAGLAALALLIVAGAGAFLVRRRRTRARV